MRGWGQDLLIFQYHVVSWCEHHVLYSHWPGLSPDGPESLALRSVLCPRWPLTPGTVSPGQTDAALVSVPPHLPWHPSPITVPSASPTPQAPRASMDPVELSWEPLWDSPHPGLYAEGHPLLKQPVIQGHETLTCQLRPARVISPTQCLRGNWIRCQHLASGFP